MSHRHQAKAISRVLDLQKSLEGGGFSSSSFERGRTQTGALESVEGSFECGVVFEMNQQSEGVLRDGLGTLDQGTRGIVPGGKGGEFLRQERTDELGVNLTQDAVRVLGTPGVHLQGFLPHPEEPLDLPA